MNYTKFEEKFGHGQSEVPLNNKEMLTPWQQGITPLIALFFANYGGKSFADGMLSVHSMKSAERWTQNCERFFPQIGEKVVCFGFDWLGRQYAVDFLGLKRAWMLDPAMGEMFKLEVGLKEFLEEVLVEDYDDLLGPVLYQNLSKNLGSMQFFDCFGFKKPLFWGREDVEANYEKVDMDVYWEINMQLLAKIKNLPDGTKFKGIRID
jgi:hypothetical protein